MRVSSKVWLSFIVVAAALCACVSHGSPVIPPGTNLAAYRASAIRADDTPMLPAYCRTFLPAKGNANSAPQKVRFFDLNKALGAQLYLYLVTGADSGAGGHQFLNRAGKLVTFRKGVNAPAIPLNCFPGSIGANGQGKIFALPPPTTALTSGNLYLVYATPRPGGGIPDPLPFKGTDVGQYSAPATDWNSGAFVDAPYDYIEYTLPHGITDVTQVNKVGLPIRLQQGQADIGFVSGAQYKALLDNILADKPYWNKLAFSATVNNHKVLGGILATQNGGVWGFPQDYMYAAKYTKKPNPSGYVGFVLRQYKLNPRPYTTRFLTDVPLRVFCASSNGTTEVLFYQVPGPAACKRALPPKKLIYRMPIVKTLKGTGVLDSGICQSAIFAMPYAGPGGLFKDQTEFYLWKAMVIDFNRGTILSDLVHPVGTWQTDPPKRPPFSLFYQEPVNSAYSHLVHKHMIGNLSYALAYDEPGGFGPTFTSEPSQWLRVTIQPIPAFAAPIPTVLPTPLPCP